MSLNSMDSIMSTPTRFLICCLISIILGACEGDISPDQYNQKARAFIDNSEDKAAIIELKNALSVDPNNQDSRLILGELYQLRGNYLAAEKELKSALQLGSPKDRVIPLLSQALLGSGKVEELMALSAANLTESSSQAILLAAQGVASITHSGMPQAEQLISKAASLGPAVPFVQLAEAIALFVSDPSGESSKNQLDKIFNDNADYAPAWSLLGDIEASGRHFEEAIQAYSRAITLRPSDYSNLDKRSLTYIYSGQFTKAQKDLNVLKKYFPKSPKISLSQGIINIETGTLEDAKSDFEGVLIAVEYYPQALMYLAQISNIQGNLDQAETYGEQYLTSRPNSKYGKLLLSNIKYKRKKYKEAAMLLRPILDEYGEDVAVLNMLAQIELKQNKFSSAVSLLQKVVEIDPSSTQAQINLGAGLLRAGENKKGFSILERSIALDSESSLADIASILGYIRLDQYDHALSAVEAFKERKPESDLPHLFMGMVHLAQKQQQVAEVALLEARKINPENSQTLLYLAAIASSKKDYSKAKFYYLEILEHQPHHLDALIQLASLASIEENYSQVESFLEQAITAYPKSVLPRLQLARHYMTNGQLSQVPRLLEPLDSTDKNLPEIIEIQLHQHLENQDYSSAKKLGKRLVDQRPQSAIPLFLLAQAYSGTGERDKAINALRKATEIKPNYIPARVVLARNLLREGGQRELKSHIDKLKRLAPDKEEVLQLEYAFARRIGSQKVALVLAKRLFEKHPSFINMDTLAKQNKGMGKPAEFIQLYETWLKQNPGSTAALISLADHYRITREEGKAIEYYEKVLTEEPENIVALNNLSWILRDKEPIQALAYANQAISLAPSAASIMDTVAMVYLSNGKYVLAERMIEKVREKVPNDLTAKYHQAVIFSSMGKKLQAIRILDELLSDKGHFSERDEATALLNKL